MDTETIPTADFLRVSTWSNTVDFTPPLKRKWALEMYCDVGDRDKLNSLLERGQFQYNGKLHGYDAPVSLIMHPRNDVKRSGDLLIIEAYAEVPVTV